MSRLLKEDAAFIGEAYEKILSEALYGGGQEEGKIPGYPKGAQAMPWHLGEVGSSFKDNESLKAGTGAFAGEVVKLVANPDTDRAVPRMHMFVQQVESYLKSTGMFRGPENADDLHELARVICRKIVIAIHAAPDKSLNLVGSAEQSLAAKKSATAKKEVGLDDRHALVGWIMTHIFEKMETGNPKYPTLSLMFGGDAVHIARDFVQALIDCKIIVHVPTGSRPGRGGGSGNTPRDLPTGGLRHRDSDEPIKF